MTASTHWLISCGVALAIGGLATVLMSRVLRPRDEAAAGIRALAGASWREFLNIVLAALARRGYHRVIDQETASGDADFTLQRDGEYWLLSCKHASSYVLGRPAVEQLANDIRLANARGGFLVTQGTILEEARVPASRHGIALLDGRELWPELRDLVKPDQRVAITGAANALARRRIALSWLLAALAGFATWMFLPEPGPAGAALAASPAPQRQAKPAIAAVAVTTDVQPAETALTLAQQREAVATAVLTLPQVTHALWTTRSTLEVHLADTRQDAAPGICLMVERYPDLAASRIQLTPPRGSGEQVRFRQCRAY